MVHWTLNKKFKFKFKLERGSSLVFQLFLLPLSFHSLISTKTLLLLDTQVCLRVPPVCTLCTALEWPAKLVNNAEITSQS
jgi:hypothetical protein